ncbi:MAG: WD40/YVTN/BNR-like repeat-containing protein, partial [Limisphaerales bacterium]
TLRAQGTAFTYQGRLDDSGSPANGIYDLRFTIYDSMIDGSAVSDSLTNFNTAVSNGLFVVTLDFGAGIFTGPDRWLDIGVRAEGVTNFTTLNPRQPLTSVPYAIFANSASNLLGNLSAAQLSGTLPASAFAGYTNTVALTNGANLFAGTFSGNGGAVTNVNVTHLTGVLADNQLPANTAFVNSNQLFSGANNFTNWGNNFTGSFFGNGLVGWIVVSNTAVQAEIDHGYVLTNSQLVTVTLPPSPNIGDIVRISGAGAGGWQIAQNANQSVFGNFLSFSNSAWTLSDASAANWYSIASSSDGAKMVAAAASLGIYISTDSGATWTATGANNFGWRAVASSADGMKLFAAVDGKGIYTNSGTSWTATSAPSKNWIAIACSADGSKIIAAVSGGGIYTSSNFGSTWTQQTSGLPTNPVWISVASSSDGNNLVAAIEGSNGRIYTSANAGVNWTEQTGAPGADWASVASSADGSGLAAAVYGGKIYTSVNFGSAWTPEVPVANWESIASSADGSKLAAVATDSGIYLSSNGGATWTQTNPTNNTAIWSSIVSSADGSKLAAAVYGGNIYYSQASLQMASTTGTNGYINGIQGSAVELQYIGNGQFMPVSSAGIIWAH